MLTLKVHSLNKVLLRSEFLCVRPAQSHRVPSQKVLLLCCHYLNTFSRDIPFVLGPRNYAIGLSVFL